MRWLSRNVAAVGVVAGVLWFVVFFVLLTGEWYLDCTLGGGIDCFQALPGSAKTDTAPASWFGFTALMWALVGATVVLAVCAAVAGRQDRERAARETRGA